MRRTCVIAVLGVAAAASGQVLNEESKLTAPDSSGGDVFGSSVAMHGEVVLIGAEQAGPGGAAYLFDVGSGQYVRTLMASDSAAVDRFGGSVDLNGAIAVVGARDADPRGTNSGAAYIFDVQSGLQLLKLVPNDGTRGDKFGSAVAIGNGVVAVSADSDDDLEPLAGSVYLFDVSTGALLHKLLPDPSESFSLFGTSLDISSGILAVGAPGDDDRGFEAGAVYLFNTQTGDRIDKLFANNAFFQDGLGWSVAIRNGMVLAGAPFDDDNGLNSGSAFFFDVNTGQQVGKLLAEDGTSGDGFGFSITVGDSYVVVGAPTDDQRGPFAGLAYVFDVATGEQLWKLTPSDLDANDQFGGAVAIAEARVSVGAKFDSDLAPIGGAAYVFVLTTPCPGDIADDFGTLGIDGMVSFGDFLALLGLVGPCPGGVPGCTGDIADDFGTLNGGDGMVSFGDFLALLGLVGPCP